MRIPITMCHGVDAKRKGPPLTIDRFAGYYRISAEMGFESIIYDDLADWLDGSAALPPRPLMFDIDHPEKSIYDEMWPIMRDYGFTGSIFINTGSLEKLYADGQQHASDRRHMNWDELAELAAAGWQMCGHTHTHPNICDLCMADPSGVKIRWELDTCNGLIEQHLGVKPPAFAFTGESFHTLAENEVKRRYRFSRLWITGQPYWADGQLVKFQDLVGRPGADEPDGGPPIATRYITRDYNPYRLPSMEFGFYLYEFDAYRRYLEGALP